MCGAHGPLNAKGPLPAKKNLTSNQTYRIYCRSFKSIIISLVSEILKFKQTEMAKLTDINIEKEYIFQKKNVYDLDNIK